MKKLGIYMEQSSAHCITFTLNLLKSKTNSTCFTFYDENTAPENFQDHMEYQEPYLQHQFFKKLIEHMLHFNEILVFGKSGACTKLFDFIAYDNRFYNIKMDLKHTESMTLNEQNDFVSDFFLLSKLS